MDARLRPEGAAGVPAIPLSTFEEYFQGRAQFWEGQALTKARPITGSAETQFAFAEFAKRTWQRFGAQPDAAAQVKAMHARVVRERAGSDDYRDFKTGRGGLMEAEFCVQATQMRHGLWEQNTVAAMAALANAGVLTNAQTSDLRDAYLFLRRVEAVVRRIENSSISSLPAQETEQRHAAIRLGFSSIESFAGKYRQARQTVHEVTGQIW